MIPLLPSPVLVWIIYGRLTPVGTVFQQRGESAGPTRDRRVKQNRGKVERWPFASSTESSVLHLFRDASISR